MPPALTAGRIDGACVLEPTLTYAKNDVRVLGKCYDAIAKRLSITTHFANNDWLAKNPAAAHAFIGALSQTAAWCNKNQAAAGVILAGITKIPPETIAQMNRVVYAEKLDVKTIQPVIDATAEYKFLPKTFNVADMFWKEANSGCTRAALRQSYLTSRCSGAVPGAGALAHHRERAAIAEVRRDRIFGTNFSDA